VKHAIVTGAKGNLGHAVTAALQHRGWNVTGIDIDDVDCTSYDAIMEWKRRHALQSVGAVVHTIGGIRAGRRIDESTPEDAAHLMQLNYMTAVNVAVAMVPELNKSAGVLIAVGAQTLLRPSVRKGFYAASKAALAALIQTLAEEGRPYGMRANIVVPSILRTPQNLAWAEHGEENTWVTPDDVAHVIATLCEPENRTSGAIIPVLGGVAL
jgi:NAD(P)-dependent dehydrogenase (short-subunit alcohol dehydrogenase family)